MIFWLASYPKSGNTWLRLLLANWFADEPIGINDMARVGMDLQDTSEILWEPFLPADEGEQLRLRPKVLERIVTARPGVTFVKTHSARGIYKEHEMIPYGISCGGIYMVRDPRDVVVSMARHMAIPLDAAIRILDTKHSALVSAEGVVQYSSDWSSHVRSWAGKDVLTIRFEDLLEDPHVEFLKVLSFLGETHRWNSKAQVAVDMCKFSALSEQEDRDGFVEARNSKFFNNGRSTWRDVLSEKQEKRIRRRHGKVMEIMRYT